MQASAHGSFSGLGRRICDVAHHGVPARTAARRVPQHFLQIQAGSCVSNQASETKQFYPDPLQVPMPKPVGLFDTSSLHAETYSSTLQGCKVHTFISAYLRS